MKEFPGTTIHLPWMNTISVYHLVKGKSIFHTSYIVILHVYQSFNFSEIDI